MRMNVIVLLLLLLNYGCNKPTALESRFLGNWKIVESENMDHKIKDSNRFPHYMTLGFQNYHNMWFLERVDRSNTKFHSAKFNMTNEADTLRLRVEDCERKELNGIYNFYILDTIFDIDNHYRVYLGFEKDDIWFVTSKSSFTFP